MYEDEINKNSQKQKTDKWNRNSLNDFINELESALIDINEYWNRSENFDAISDICLHNVETASEAIKRIKLFIHRK